jgi:hypothetical protein
MEPTIEQSLPPVQTSSKNNVLAIISLVTGIIGLLFSCAALVPFIGWLSLICVAPCGLAALITGIIALTQVKKTGEKGKGMAMAGLIMGVLGITLVCVLQLLWPTLLTLMGPTIGNVFTDINTNLQP